MEESNNSTTKISFWVSKAISAIGHPLVLVMLAALYINFKSFETEKAIRLSLLVFGLVFIPMFGYLWYKIKKGVYNDFDVSNQKKRNSLYIFAVFLLTVLTAFLFIEDYDKQISMGVLTVLLHISLSFALNQKIKVSLHAGFSFLLAVMMIKVDYPGAYTLLLFALLNSYSRIHLKRHSVPEVAIGAGLGILVGSFFLFLA